MKKRVKKKHEHRYWLRNAKERRAAWREFLESFSELTSEEVAECIAQGTEDAKKELAELKEQDHE